MSKELQLVIMSSSAQIFVMHDKIQDQETHIIAIVAGPRAQRRIMTRCRRPFILLDQSVAQSCPRAWTPARFQPMQLTLRS